MTICARVRELVSFLSAHHREGEGKDDKGNARRQQRTQQDGDDPCNRKKREDPTKKFVHLHRRQQLPSINLPTYLPDGDSSSRDGSPYLPPEEIRSAKKA
ncbi:hypothetical protein L3Y34_003004 [Caenorhabditis briggsae]|uniref:Uncharacterized protein n=1 Tax=Caenorhabditis briggsae TaxID=6238 RepID=A0AAE9AEY4_CAEBR|nr:hypothetical protein L3Y34_003004 [Caenorhabditis briggsae]